MDGADAERWSGVADGWAELWTPFAAPAWRAVAEAAGVGPGSRVLDVGCGSGGFLAHAAGLGAVVAGVDPAAGMVAVARRTVPAADVRDGDAERLPWPDASFDVVTAFNALQFAGDLSAALAELARVAVPGGRVAVANWAEDARCDLATIEAAVAVAAGEEPAPEGELRQVGELEALMAGAGLTGVVAGLVELPWRAADDDELVRGVLLGEDAAVVAETAPVVVAAAVPFRQPGGGYLLGNAFRYAVGTTAR